MKTAILAVEPTMLEKPWFDQLGRIVRALQRRGEIPELSVLSIVHHGAFLVPWSYYQKWRVELQDGVRHDLSNRMPGHFAINRVDVRNSHSSHAEDLAAEITAAAEESAADLIVLVSENRSRFSKVMFGSVSYEVKKLWTKRLLIINPFNDDLRTPNYAEAEFVPGDRKPKASPPELQWLRSPG